MTTETKPRTFFLDTSVLIEDPDCIEEFLDKDTNTVIVTDDNPRSEEPASIRAAILEAAPGATEIGDRRAAIRAAAAQMVEGDVLVVAGKGHEQGQLVAGVNHPFDDVTETLAALEMADV